MTPGGGAGPHAPPGAVRRPDRSAWRPRLRRQLRRRGQTASGSHAHLNRCVTCARWAASRRNTRCVPSCYRVLSRPCKLLPRSLPDCECGVTRRQAGASDQSVTMPRVAGASLPVGLQGKPSIRRRALPNPPNPRPWHPSQGKVRSPRLVLLTLLAVVMLGLYGLLSFGYRVAAGKHAPPLSVVVRTIDSCIAGLSTTPKTQADALVHVCRCTLCCNEPRPRALQSVLLGMRVAQTREI